jgi:uncharacterized membrane protein YhaH (DUF805 family)
MSELKSLLFGFEGRINRARHWVAGLIVGGTALVLAMLLLGVTFILGASKPLSFAFQGNDVFRIIDPAALRLAIEKLRNADLSSAATLLPLLFRLIVTPVAVWCCVAILIKRLHDRNKSAWWGIPFFVVPGLYQQFEDRLGDSDVTVLAGLIASVLGLWCFIEIVCLRGTKGPNRFGADPLAPVDTRPPWDQQSELEFVPHAAGPSPQRHGKRGG